MDTSRSSSRIGGRAGRHPMRGLVIVVVLLALVAGCTSSSDGGDGAEQGADGTGSESTDSGATDAEPADFSQRGPFEVGVVDLQLGDRTVAVFYPTDAVPDDAVSYTYSGAELFGPEIAEALPGAFGDDQPVDAYVDAPPSEEGPFPLVLHSHGFSSYFRFSGRHNAQMASWGFVVAAVDHVERNLLAVFTGAGGGGASADADRDVDDLGAAIDLLVEQSAAAGSPVEGLVDGEQIAAEGHSAGGSAAASIAYDDRVDTWIGLAPALPVPASALPEGTSYEDLDVEAFLAETEPPDKPSMIIAADGDIAIPLDQVEQEFDWLVPPKRLVVLDQAGHNAFTDICAPIQDEGGLQAVIDELGLGGNEAVARFVALGEDGCTADNPPAADGFALFDHLTVAQLRWVFDIDRSEAAASLSEAYLTETFPDLIESYQVEE